jgi:uncharacterized protein
MTKERLQDLPLEALREMANRIEISFHQSIERDALVDLIYDAVEEEKSERENSNNSAMRVKEKKFDIIENEDVASAASDEFELPDSYNETMISLLLRDPLWGFAYWDLKEAEVEAIKSTPNSRLLLRVYQLDADAPGRKKRRRPFEIPVKISDRSWYINLPKTGTRYSLELIMQGGQGEKVLCASNSIESPKISINPTSDSSADESFYSILAVSGLRESSDFSEKGGIPQRIISLLDTQYLHLQG